jgi:hypothetical protein
VDINHQAFARVAWAGNGLLALALIHALITGDWLAALFLGGFLAMAAVFVAFESRLPSLFDVLFVSAALVNAVGWAWDYYTSIAGYDEAVHFYTTFAVTLSVGYFTFFAMREHFRHHRAHFVLVISSFGISIGALWEIFELFVLPQPDNVAEDLLMDTFGAVLAGFLAAWALGAENRDSSGQAALGSDQPAG